MGILLGHYKSVSSQEENGAKLGTTMSVLIRYGNSKGIEHGPFS